MCHWQPIKFSDSDKIHRIIEDYPRNIPAITNNYSETAKTAYLQVIENYKLPKHSNCEAFAMKYGNSIKTSTKILIVKFERYC